MEALAAAGVTRAALLEPVKADARNLEAWAALIRFDAIAAAAGVSGGGGGGGSGGEAGGEGGCWFRPCAKPWA